MNDLISRRAAIKRLEEFANDDMISTEKAIGADCCVELIRVLPSAQPEPSIPLSWFDEQIERLKSLDNAFATLTAMQISGMVKKWRDEQDE